MTDLDSNPPPQALPVFWFEADALERSREPSLCFSAVVSEQRWQLRVDEPNAKPCYTLLIDELVSESFAEFPTAWSRPDEPARKPVPTVVSDDPVRQVRERAYAKWEQASHPIGDGIGDWLAAEAELRYLHCVAPLPLPTAAQTAAFAAYVLSAHSWYKHLRHTDARTRLIAFLNPDAGMQVGDIGGREVVSPFVTQKDCWHYSQIPTAEYLRKFGHWSYWVVPPWGDPQLTIRVANSYRLPVPAQVWQRSGCPVWTLLSPGDHVPTAFESGRRWFAIERGDVSALSDSLARLAIHAVVSADLIAVREFEAAVAGVAEQLAAASADQPTAVVRYLGRSDNIDEIYATDGELRAAVHEALCRARFH